MKAAVLLWRSGSDANINRGQNINGCFEGWNWTRVCVLNKYEVFCHAQTAGCRNLCPPESQIRASGGELVSCCHS